MPEERYRRRSYEPDCEFEALTAPQGARAEMQAALAAYLFRHRKTWNLSVGTEARVELKDPGCAGIWPPSVW